MRSEARGKPYRPWNPEHSRQEAPSPEAQWPEDDLVFFVLETVPPLAVSRVSAPYEAATRGAPPFAPKMRGWLLLSAYGVGVFSSRKIAQAGARPLAFIAIVGQDRPDFRPISDFRTLPLPAFCDVVGPVRRIAGEAGLVQLGTVSTAGPKRQGHAARHNAMSYGYMKQDVERLREEIEALVPQAPQQDVQDEAVLGSRRGDEWPAELARREDRLATIEAAMRRLEARARAAAEAERQRTGKTRRGNAPKKVDETPRDKAQRRCTAPELGIMPTNNQGGE